ncbi:MAG TPA: hypothetical protein VGQ57_14305, partial [Polyangiaceae bacterium]|nr:hypothetical protein [Polyangiaceae bacterium]
MILPGELETLRAIARAEPPAGLLPAETRHVLGVRWATRAHNENRTSAAFSEVSRCLEESGAPAELVAVAQRGTADEARHARECALAAEYYGAEPTALAAPAAVPRAR